jgi:hypothetical protein
MLVVKEEAIFFSYPTGLYFCHIDVMLWNQTPTQYVPKVKRLEPGALPKFPLTSSWCGCLNTETTVYIHLLLKASVKMQRTPLSGTRYLRIGARNEINSLTLKLKCKTVYLFGKYGLQIQYFSLFVVYLTMMSTVQTM